MKNKFFNNFKAVIGILFFNIVLSSTFNLDVNDQWEVENNLNSKIKNVISNLYSINQFAVTSNVVLLGVNNTTSNSTSSFGALELEGILPSLPQSSSSATTTNADNYKIQIKDITVWLDYDLDIIDAQQNIKKFLFESIDWLEDCGNCLKFRSKAFPSGASNNPSFSQSNSTYGNDGTYDATISNIEDNIAYLTEQIEKYETNSDTEKNQWMIDWLNRALQEEKELNANLSDQIMENAQNVIRRDSSIIMNTTMGQKEIAETAMKENSRIVEKVSDNQFENNRYMLIVLFVLIGIVVLLVLLSFFNKGPKTVYLKPKDQKDQSENNNSDASNLSKSSNVSVNTPIASETLQAELTKAYEDDSVLQSDLKTIKQSAVKMSVGQKHEASQILKDWLDDGKSDDGTNSDTTDEESK